MLSGHGSASRRRRNSRAARIAVPLAIPMALGLTLGIVLAVSGGGNTTTIEQSALGSCASAAADTSTSTPAPDADDATTSAPAPDADDATTSAPAPDADDATSSAPAPAASASAVAPAASASAPAAAPSAAAASAAPAPCPSASASAAVAAATVAGIPPINPPGRPGLAGSNAVDAAGNAFSFAQTQAEAADSTNCTVTVPNRPLTARGLATPWVLGDGCTWANGDTEGVFIDATILAPNGRLQVYNPLVITQGTTPEVAPTRPKIARGSQVILSVGYNGNALALVGRGARQGNCIDALGASLINQTPQCNAVNFYRMANRQIARGTLKVPAAGTGMDGQACQTTRDFALIDQDQSDNAVASYLFNAATGQTSQATAANQANLTQDTPQTNGSDNGLLDKFVDPALGCTPFTAPNSTNPAGAGASQALNELSARQNQKGTIALLPVNNPQLLVGGQFSLAKTNLYRAETDMPLLPLNTNLERNAAMYCQNMINIATPRLKLDAPMETGTASPVPDLGDNLATFLAARLSGSFDNLNCKNYGLTNPVTLTTDANGVATAATFNTTPQKATTGGGRTGRGHGAGRHHWRHRFMPGRNGHM
jgi:hypothetical protein